MNKPPVAEMIAFLVGSRFPDHQWLRDPARPRVRRSGENAPELPEDQRLASVAELEAYEAELSATRPEEVSALYDAERRRHAEEARRRRQARAEHEERDRFFNRPSANADFAHWSKAAYWTIDEGVALILGRAPAVVNWEAVRDYAEVSSFARRYGQVRDLALRSQESGRLARPVKPGAFLDWAKRTGIDYSPELQEQVLSKAVADLPQAPPDKVATKEKSLSFRERDTVLKMLGGMAVMKYGYNPKAARNNAVTEIANDLDAAGVHVDVDTVRKWLKEAADLIPPEAHDDPDR